MKFRLTGGVCIGGWGNSGLGRNQSGFFAVSQQTQRHNREPEAEALYEHTHLKFGGNEM
jgi:hypothetical protein